MRLRAGRRPGNVVPALWYCGRQMLIEWCEACERQAATLYRAASGELRVRYGPDADLTVAELLRAATIVDATPQERAMLEAGGLWEQPPDQAP